MAFDFDIEYVKGNSIPLEDSLWGLRFCMELKDKTEFKDTFLHLVETDVFSLDKMAAETKHDPVLRWMTSRIRKIVRGKCSWAERPYKEMT